MAKSVTICKCSIYWRLWIKIRILVNEVHLKSIKEKLFKITSFTHYHFHWNEKDFLRRFIMGNDNLSIHRKSLGISCTIIQRYHPGLMQYKIPADIIFLPYIETWWAIGAFQRRNHGNYSNVWINMVWTVFINTE